MKALKSWQKCLLYCTAVVVLSFGAARLYYRLTDDFRIANISYPLPHRQEWEVTPLVLSEQQHIAEILQQSYFYIGKGAQSYAFVSQDGLYVLKFFKFKHLRPADWLSWLPPLESVKKYQHKQQIRKQRKLEGVFAGYRTAYELHRTDSGLLFIHLNTTENSYPIVTLFDKMGRRHKIALDEFPFILQYKVVTVRQVFEDLLKQGNVAEVKEAIDRIFALYCSEYDKGIVDHDHGVMRNIGFAGKKPIHLDVGKMHQEDDILKKSNQVKDLAIVAQRMKNWLDHNLSEYSAELAAHIDAAVFMFAKEAD